MSNEMRNVVKEVRELEREVKWLAEEVRLHEYCRGHGLDFTDSSDYAAAVAAVRKRDADGGDPGRVPGGESEGHMLHYGNSVAAPGISCYNEIELAEKIYSIDRELDLISEYNFFQDLGEKLKSGWKKTKERAVELGNKAREAAIMGEFLLSIRSTNRQYRKCMEEEQERVQQKCSNETGRRKMKCETVASKKWRSICNKKAIRNAKRATMSLREKTTNPDIRKFVGGLNILYDFEEFMQVMENFIRNNYPEFAGYLKYM